MAQVKKRVNKDDAQEGVPGIHSMPHSMEMERAVLGCVMADNTAFEDIDIDLRPEDFYSKGNGIIFAAAKVFMEKGQPFDAIIIAEYLEQTGEIEKVGGLDTMFALLEANVGNVQIASYARTVKELSIRRQGIKACNQSSALFLQPANRPLNEVISQAQEAMFGLNEGNASAGQVVSIRDVLIKSIDRLEQLAQMDSPITGLSTGFDALDEITAGLQPSDMIVLAARPSMGKTTLALNIGQHAAQHSGKSVMVFSLEMPADQLGLRMLSSLSEVDATRLRNGKLTDEDWDKLVPAVSAINEMDLHIDDSSSLTPAELRSRVLRHARKHDLGLIVIDYLQLMSAPGFDNPVNEVTEISRAIKRVAKDFQVPIIVLSQLNRNLEQRPNKRPVNSDLRTSGGIEQDADVIMFAYRDEVYNPDTQDRGKAEIILGKQRNGPIGTVRLGYQGHFNRFTNLSAKESQIIQ